MKKKLFWMFTLLILSASGFARGITINGLVSDVKTGEMIPTVNNGLMLGVGQKETKLNKVSIITQKKYLKF